MTERSRPPLLPPAPPRIERGRGQPVAQAQARSAPAAALEQNAFGDMFDPPAEQPAPEPAPADPTETNGKRPPPTETLGRRAGALSDELDFPDFVASLVHGTFNAIVDSSIRQMESFADLVAAVAKPIDQFADENVTLNQARDWLAERYPTDLGVDAEQGGHRLVPVGAGEDGSPPAPEWLEEFGLSGAELTPELIEDELLPRARRRVAQDRLQTLSTMVLLGMNRVVVKDGTIAARLRFRASAAEKSKVDYAVSDDPGGGQGEWGRRGARTYAAPSTKVSTVGVNTQSDTELKAELFGEVRINFASETVPLDRFADDARRAMLERHARPPRPPARSAPPPAAPEPAAAAPAATPPAAPAPATPAPQGGRP
jgi:hypothetical protein